MIKLGQKINCGSPVEISMSEDVEKEVYPSLYIRTEEEIKLPEGRFKFSGEGKVIEKIEKDKDGKECYSYEIEVYAMQPEGKVKDEEEEELGMESMADAFSRAAKRKMKEKRMMAEDEEYED